MTATYEMGESVVTVGKRAKLMERKRKRDEEDEQAKNKKNEKRRMDSKNKRLRFDVAVLPDATRRQQPIESHNVILNGPDTIDRLYRQQVVFHSTFWKIPFHVG